MAVTRQYCQITMLKAANKREFSICGEKHPTGLHG